MKVDTKRLKKTMFLSLPYVIFGLICTNIGEAWRLAEGADYSAKVLSFFSTIGIAFGNPLPSFYPVDLLTGLIGGAGLRLAVFIKSQNKKNYKQGVEYGSARWGTHADIEPFMDPKFENNVVLIVGGSGSGKTRFWIKPNLLQLHSSYVLTDPNR